MIVDSVSSFNNTTEFLMITNIFTNLGSDVDIADTETMEANQEIQTNLINEHDNHENT